MTPISLPDGRYLIYNPSLCMFSSGYSPCFPLLHVHYLNSSVIQFHAATQFPKTLPDQSDLFISMVFFHRGKTFFLLTDKLSLYPIKSFQITSYKKKILHCNQTIKKSDFIHCEDKLPGSRNQHESHESEVRCLQTLFQRSSLDLNLHVTAAFSE